MMHLHREVDCNRRHVFDADAPAPAAVNDGLQAVFVLRLVALPEMLRQRDYVFECNCAVLVVVP